MAAFYTEVNIENIVAKKVDFQGHWRVSTNGRNTVYQGPESFIIEKVEMLLDRRLTASERSKFYETVRDLNNA